MSLQQYLKVVICFIILTGLTKFFVKFCVDEVFEIFIFLQTFLFLTDSVFFVLCACFDDSMVLFNDFLPYKSWNKEDIMQK